MPIVFSCYSCGKAFRVKDALAGKAIQCPGCAAAIQVPGQTADSPAAASGAVAPQWYVKTPDGQAFGPIAQGELDQWVAEGRVTAETQILQQGATQWQWADVHYPQLAQPRPVLPPAATTVPPVAFPTTQPPPAGPVHGSGALRSEPGHRTGSRKAPSAAVNAVAILSFLIGAIHGSCGCFSLSALGGFLRGVAEDFEEFQELHGADRMRDAELFMVVVGVIGATMVAIAGLYIMAGYAVMMRRSWGRILCIGLGVYTAILALLDLVCVAQGYSMCLPGFLICAGYSTVVFAVLLNPRFAQEFTSRRSGRYGG